ncbi:MAG: ThiF family adenylyltransferase [Myxococcales bacterium]|nr:ThiF family adenylyltransferase [Myxococcales bacterium]
MTTRIVIVGVGALGSHVVQFLRSLPEVALTVVDFDRVEQKNTLSQFHPKQSVGRGKVLALQQTMSFLFGTKLRTIPHRLTSDNVEAVLGGAELLVDCLDNAESRRLISAFARAEGIPCIHGALAADGGFGRVVWEGAFTPDAEPASGAATCEDGEHLPFIVANAAYLALAIQRFVANGEQVGFSLHPGGVTTT